MEILGNKRKFYFQGYVILCLTVLPYWYNLTIMTSIEFKKIQAELKLTNKEMASALITSPRNIANWRCGKIRVPGPVIVAMYCLIERQTK